MARSDHPDQCDQERCSGCSAIVDSYRFLCICMHIFRRQKGALLGCSTSFLGPSSSRCSDQAAAARGTSAVPIIRSAPTHNCQLQPFVTISRQLYMPVGIYTCPLSLTLIPPLATPSVRSILLLPDDTLLWFALLLQLLDHANTLSSSSWRLTIQYRMPFRPLSAVL